MTSQIFDYNHTKAGVDTLDQMCRMYSARSTTKRWPLVHFQNLLDVAGINAQTVFDEAHPSWSNIRRKDRRRFFLKQLANQLAREHMTERLRKKSGLQKSTISALESYVGQHKRTIFMKSRQDPGTGIPAGSWSIPPGSWSSCPRFPPGNTRIFHNPARKYQDFS